MLSIKRLLLFVHPLGLAWLMLALWLAWRLWRRQRQGLLIPATAWLVLTFFSCTPLTSWLLLQLENRFPQVSIQGAPMADVIVCLGGGAAPSLSEPTGVNFNSSSDRITCALGLLAQGKATHLVVAGGGYRENGVWYSEADASVHYFKDTLKMPHSIQSLGICTDTHDEALKVVALAREKGWNKALLVTSAAHMPRAAATFRKAGVDVMPVPCDYISSFMSIGNDSWLHLPQLGSFQGISSWLHEIIGLAVYKMRGWI